MIKEDTMDNSLNIKKRRKVSLDSRRARGGYVFVAPFLIGVILIYIPMLIDSIWFSFNQLSIQMVEGIPTQVLIPKGLEYYVYAFTESPDFVTKLLEGLQQLIFEVPAIIIFSLFIAVVLNGKMLGRAAFRAIFFVPVIISTGLMEAINGADIASGEMSGGVDDGTGGTAGAGIISTLDVANLFQTMAIGGELVGYVVGLVNDIYNIINFSGVHFFWIE